MSKLSVLNDAIEKLEEAEISLVKARRAFPSNSLEYDRLDSQFEVVGDALAIVKRILAHVEQEKISITPKESK